MSGYGRISIAGLANVLGASHRDPFTAVQFVDEVKRQELASRATRRCYSLGISWLAWIPGIRISKQSDKFYVEEQIHDNELVPTS